MKHHQGRPGNDSGQSSGFGFGGKTWHVPQAEPKVSECLELVRAARAGDEYAQWRVEELYEPPSE